VGIQSEPAASELRYRMADGVELVGRRLGRGGLAAGAAAAWRRPDPACLEAHCRGAGAARLSRRRRRPARPWRQRLVGGWRLRHRPLRPGRAPAGRGVRTEAGADRRLARRAGQPESPRARRRIRSPPRWCWWTSRRASKPRASRASAASWRRISRTASPVWTYAADAVAAYLPHRKRPTKLDGLRKNLRLGPDGRYRWHYDPAFVRGMPQPRRRCARSAPDRGGAGGSPCRCCWCAAAPASWCPRTSPREFVAQVPNAAYVDVHGAAHMVAGDVNDPFTAQVVAFLDRLAQP